MFNPTAVVIDAFVDELRKGYISTYTTLEPDYPGIIEYIGHMALELIANSDAPYHDLGHTICVTLVGQEVIKGKHLREGGVGPARLVALHHLAVVSRHRLRTWDL